MEEKQASSLINLKEGIIDVKGSEQFVSERTDKFLTFIKELKWPIINETTVPLEKQNFDDPKLLNENIVLEVNNEFPTLDDLVLRNVPKTEKEWVLIYGFYASSFGKNSFTKEAIKELYKSTKRFTDVRMGNFQTNFKDNAKDKYFSALNTTEFTITDLGKEKAQKIVLEEQDKSTKKQREKDTTPSKKSYSMLNLELTEIEREELKKYFSSYQTKSSMEIVTILANWLKLKKNAEEVGSDEIFTLLRTADQPISFDIDSALSNAKNLKSYFVAGTIKGKFKIHYVGEDLVKKLKTVGTETK